MKKASDNDIRWAAAQIQAGMSVRQACREIGIAPVSYYKRVERMGISQPTAIDRFLARPAKGAA